MEKISAVRPDKIDSKIIQTIKDNIPRKGKPAKLDTQLSELINNVFNLAKNLGDGWIEGMKSRTGYVWNVTKCPQCDLNVQFLFWKQGNYRLVKLDIPKS